MITKRFRLTEGEIERVFRKGKPFFGQFWMMQVAPARSIKVGVSVSKKHDKRAVVRNKYRRMLYDAVAQSVGIGSEIQMGPVHMFFSIKKGIKIEREPSMLWREDVIRMVHTLQKNPLPPTAVRRPLPPR